jgi:5-methyltetrahydrofolate--homocysteine methyltransferase
VVNPIRRWLENGPLLADGAWGTEFQRLGLAQSECADAWNLAHPDRVEAVARSYVEAGSQIILTNTFRANAVSLAAHGLENRVMELNTAGVTISKRAAAGAAKVVASIGPCGDEVALLAQAEALAAAGADALLLETFTDLAEARIALSAAKRTGLPVIVSFAFVGSLTPEQAASTMQAAGADAVGANCGGETYEFAAICARLAASCDLPLWLKPSAGTSQIVTAGEFASRARDLVAAGAGIVGGCCGTTPEYIGEMRRENIF